MHAQEDKKKLPTEEEENQENQKEKEPEIEPKVRILFSRNERQHARVVTAVHVFSACVFGTCAYMTHHYGKDGTYAS